MSSIRPVVSPRKTNIHMVLISLQGGGIAGARFGGQMESIHVSSLGLINALTVDTGTAPNIASRPPAKMWLRSNGSETRLRS